MRAIVVPFTAASDGRPPRSTLAVARTIIGLSDITRVRIESNGRPWNFPLMRGGISTRVWDYPLLVGLWVGNFKALP
jgi:hypothetical protein